MLHKIIRSAEIFNIAVVITNQVAIPDTFVRDPTTAGGNIVAHSSTYRIYLTKSGDDEWQGEISGGPYNRTLEFL